MRTLLVVFVKLFMALCFILLFGLSASATDYALSIYAGQLTTEKWEQAILPTAEFVDATIVVTAMSWTFARFFDHGLSLELEGQVGKYFGDQDHWELNFPIFGLRWHRFPWDAHVATSFAWGIGPSYASEIPPIELETNDSSNRWLVYWYAEVTLGPPKKAWEALFRLHHRSDSFGLVADDGGSNAVCAGIRYRF
jgi:hypothetical protein